MLIEDGKCQEITKSAKKKRIRFRMLSNLAVWFILITVTFCLKLLYQL